MATDFSGLTVLVVDDQQHVRELVRAQLAAFGVTQVAEASSGRAAMQAVTAPGTSFDLILCDLRMPEMDGIETLRTLGSLGLRATVAILSVEDERVIQTAGVLATLGGLRLVGEVTKPLTPEKLEAVLTRTMSDVAPAAARPVVSEAEVLAALEADAVEIYFQPKLNLHSGTCVGAEATLQWTHPAHGLIPMEELLPVAEHSREVLTKLTTLALREGIAACGRWQAAGHEIGVSINLSPRVLGQLNLPEYVEQLALAHRVQPARITVEVAETTLGGDLSPMLEVAARLRIKGFRLALDDFTGANSGVQEILKIPFSELKLSRDCVDGCSAVDRKRAIVETGLALARGLRLSTVATGILKRPDWTLLSQLGCDIGQGNFLARAMPEQGLGVWVTQWMLQKKG